MKRSPHISDSSSSSSSFLNSRLNSDTTTSSNTNMRTTMNRNMNKNTQKKRFHSSELQRQKSKLKPIVFPKLKTARVDESTQVLVANFLQNASEKGELYNKAGVEYAGFAILRLIIYYYLMQKSWPM